MDWHTLVQIYVNVIHGLYEVSMYREVAATQQKRAGPHQQQQQRRTLRVVSPGGEQPKVRDERYLAFYEWFLDA